VDGPQLADGAVLVAQLLQVRVAPAEQVGVDDLPQLERRQVGVRGREQVGRLAGRLQQPRGLPVGVRLRLLVGVQWQRRRPAGDQVLRPPHRRHVQRRLLGDPHVVELVVTDVERLEDARAGQRVLRVLQLRRLRPAAEHTIEHVHRFTASAVAFVL
jgi:hypothetical protein